jgi:hypothetical protein
MLLTFYALTAVLLVAALSRDHDLAASEQTVLAARLVLDGDALAAYPYRVTLEPCSVRDFEYLELLAPAREALASEGFRAAGTFAIREFSGAGVQLFVNAEDRLTAAIYEYEGAGVWVEVASHYEDGGRITHTTLHAPGLPAPEGHRVVSLAGLPISGLLAFARSDRSRYGLVQPDTTTVRARFEADYAAWVAAVHAQLADEEREAA